jgi:hypothetical protein
MNPIQHPQRCETCNKIECVFSITKWYSTWHSDLYYFINKMGCASHSTVSGQPQQSKLFGITEEEIEKFGDYVEDDENHTEEKYKNARGLAAKIRSRPVHQQQEQAVRDLDKLVKWLYSEGIKFEKMCDSEENYITAASACARRAQCYYTIEKIAELRQSAKEPVQEGRAPGDER